MLAALVLMGNASAAAGAASDTTEAGSSDHVAWWREARFGLFIHWGLYAIPAGMWNGKPTPGMGEHIMQRAKIPVGEYEKLAAQFNPTAFDADAWISLARQAGMKYVVLTAKHHDGFAMFDSAASRWDIVDATPFGRDVVKELAEACARHGLKFGVYYSHARDWYHPGGADFRGHWDPARQDGDMMEYIKNVAAVQVRELLTNYGPISILWWDTPDLMTPAHAAVLEPLVKLQPGVIMNNRLGGGVDGDFYTPENVVPASGLPGNWETCMTMNRTWGYRVDDNDWKDTTTLIRHLIDTASKGGNLLLNIGPMANGEIPVPSVERLREIGEWMGKNSVSIYGTSGVPFRRLSWGRATRKEDRIYLHVFDWPTDGILRVPARGEVGGAHLLVQPDRALKIEGAEDGLRVKLPAQAPDRIASVVVLTGVREFDVLPPPPIRQSDDGTLMLACDTADLHGPHLRLAGNTWLNLIGWDTLDSRVEWDVEIERPGDYRVMLHYIAHAEQAGSDFVFQVGDAELRGKVAASRNQTVELGKITLKRSGPQKVVLKPETIAAKEFLRLRTITLQPL